MASGLAELDPPTCSDLCASGSPQESSRGELIDPDVDITDERAMLNTNVVSSKSQNEVGRSALGVLPRSCSDLWPADILRMLLHHRGRK